MKKVRIGNTIVMRFDVLTNGQGRPLEGRDIAVVLKDPKGTVMPMTFATDGTHVEVKLDGKDQRLIGQYLIEVWENRGKENQAVLDFDAVCLVSRTKYTGCNG